MKLLTILPIKDRLLIVSGVFVILLSVYYPAVGSMSDRGMLVLTVALFYCNIGTLLANIRALYSLH